MNRKEYRNQGSKTKNNASDQLKKKEREFRKKEQELQMVGRIHIIIS